MKRIDHDGFHIQWDPGSGPIYSPCRESRYVDGVGMDEWRRQKRRDYLNEYRRKKTCGFTGGGPVNKRMFYTKALLTSLPVATKLLPAAPEDPAAESIDARVAGFAGKIARGADTGV